MKHITIRETRLGLSRLEELLAEGEVIITRRGKPVARLLPIGGARPIPSHKELRESMPPVKGSEYLQHEERDA